MSRGSLTIWTIGHSTRTIEEFIDLVRRYQIEILVDVRHFPGSRRLPHLNRDTLHRALGAAGIRYEHLVELGGRRPPRPDSCNEFKGMTAGVGPVLGYIKPIGRNSLALEAKWLPELDTKNRLEGDYIWVRAAYKF